MDRDPYVTLPVTSDEVIHPFSVVGRCGRLKTRHARVRLSEVAARTRGCCQSDSDAAAFAAYRDRAGDPGDALAVVTRWHKPDSQTPRELFATKVIAEVEAVHVERVLDVVTLMRLPAQLLDLLTLAGGLDGDALVETLPVDGPSGVQLVETTAALHGLGGVTPELPLAEAWQVARRLAA